MGVAIYNAVAAAIGGFLGPFVVGAFVQRTGSFVSSMVVMGAFLAWAGLMMIALGVYTQVKKRADKRIPAARYGSESVTSTTDLLRSVDRNNDKDQDAAAAMDVELAVRLHQSGY